ncbi:LysR family transcriptional regulator [Azohydromonas caseinilytica]|uniref:LysR family transcriptional regulator n=1 Tax=Azohydromonas caseinilytica TaxID=2728836 RepID=A0A848FH92_9BURK|nr:LysR family transcriptional regulator [Azohydromonas caseinilytica]NML17570.1 LysR family transcriptional regulator [Azohydromonas caseinilytica]
MAFLAVVESGSFTRAAERLGCSKTYVSKQVSSLEQALGAKLLHRTTRRLQPTETGTTYLDYCRRLRETLSEAERAVSSLRTEARGRVRLSVPTTLGMELMAEMLVALHAQHPELEVDLDLDLDPGAQPREAAETDLALRFTREPDPALVAKPLAVLHDWVVAHPSLLQRHGTPAKPADLARLPCLSNSRYKGEEQWLLTKDGKQQPVEVRHWLRINNDPLMKRLALEGQGFARLPAFLVLNEVDRGELVQVLPEWELAPTPLYLVYPDQRPLPRKVRATVDFVADWFTRRKAGTLV